MSFHIPSLQEFISFARVNPFIRSDRFVVNFSVPTALNYYNGNDIRDIDMLCEEAAFQGKTIGTRTLRINALNEYRAHTADYMGDSITFQFLTDINWKARKFFDAWLNECVTDAKTRRVGFYQDYVCNEIKIGSLVPVTNLSEPTAVSNFNTVEGSAEQIVWGMKLVEAFPKAINVQQVSYSNQSYIRLNVTFNYKYWEPIDTQGDLQKTNTNVTSDEFNNLVAGIRPTLVSRPPTIQTFNVFG